MVLAPTLEAIHAKSARHKQALLESPLCGCFSCLRIYPPSEITQWVRRDDDETAVCPHCSTDAVLPSATVDLTPELLSAMNARWFRGSTEPVNEAARRGLLISIEETLD